MFELPHSFKPQQKIYLLIGFFVVVSVAMIVLFIYPTLREIIQGSQDIVSEKSRAAQITFETNELQYFKKQSQEYQPHLATIEKLLIDAENPINFIEFLETLARQFSLEANISLSPTVKSETLSGLPVATFQVDLKGDFRKIFLWIEKLETGPYLIKIQTVTIIQQIEKDSVGPGVEARFLIKVVKINK